MPYENLAVVILGTDKLLLRKLNSLVSKAAGYQVVAIIQHTADALSYIFANTTDLILATNQLEGPLSGYQIAEKLQFTNLPFILVKNTQDKKEEIPQTSFVYLKSPFTKTTLDTALTNALAQIKIKKDAAFNPYAPLNKSLFFRIRAVYKKIAIAEVLYVEAQKNYVSVITKTEKFVINKKLSEIANLLIEHGFLHIHRSYVVNIEKISGIDVSNNLLYIGEKSIPIGRTKKKQLMEEINFLL